MTDTVLAFNRELAKELGIGAALLFQELQRKSHYWESQGQLNEQGEFWCDQKDIADWILLHPNNVGIAAKKLEDAGLISKRTGYRPKSTTTTTWWKVLIPGINETVIPRNQRNSDSYIKSNTEADTTAQTENRDSYEPQSTQSPVVVFLRVNPSGRAWKSQRVYSTQEEVDNLEAMDPDDNVNFKYWKSPKMVGDDARAKFKRMKVKLVQPDIAEEETEEEKGVDLWQ